MVNDVPFYMAFLAGLISFLSPCVLPLVPGYVSFISGVSVEQLEKKGGDSNAMGREKTLILFNSLAFVIGFSTVFVLLGASATLVGSFITANMSFLTRIAGLVIIFFGLFKIGLLRIFAFYREARFHPADRKYGLIGALLIGAAFAFGWTPCIGPILGGILAYAGTMGTVPQGMALLFLYSLGLGIPFLLTAVGISRFFGFFEKVKKHLRLIEVISGVIMVLLGLMIFFNKLILIPGYLTFLNRFSL